jgi:hypothetical protein
MQNVTLVRGNACFATREDRFAPGGSIAGIVRFFTGVLRRMDSDSSAVSMTCRWYSRCVATLCARSRRRARGWGERSIRSSRLMKATRGVGNSARARAKSPPVGRGDSLGRTSRSIRCGNEVNRRIMLRMTMLDTHRLESGIF